MATDLKDMYRLIKDEYYGEGDMESYLLHTRSSDSFFILPESYGVITGGRVISITGMSNNALGTARDVSVMSVLPVDTDLAKQSNIELYGENATVLLAGHDVYGEKITDFTYAKIDSNFTLHHASYRHGRTSAIHYQFVDKKEYEESGNGMLLIQSQGGDLRSCYPAIILEDDWKLKKDADIRVRSDVYRVNGTPYVAQYNTKACICLNYTIDADKKLLIQSDFTGHWFAHGSEISYRDNCPVYLVNAIAKGENITFEYNNVAQQEAIINTTTMDECISTYTFDDDIAKNAFFEINENKILLQKFFKENKRNKDYVEKFFDKKENLLKLKEDVKDTGIEVKEVKKVVVFGEKVDYDKFLKPYIEVKVEIETKEGDDEIITYMMPLPEERFVIASDFPITRGSVFYTRNDEFRDEPNSKTTLACQLREELKIPQDTEQEKEMTYGATSGTPEVTSDTQLASVGNFYNDGSESSKWAYTIQTPFSGKWTSQMPFSATVSVIKYATAMHGCAVQAFGLLADKNMTAISGVWAPQMMVESSDSTLIQQDGLSTESAVINNAVRAIGVTAGEKIDISLVDCLKIFEGDYTFDLTVKANNNQFWSDWNYERFNNVTAAGFYAPEVYLHCFEKGMITVENSHNENQDTLLSKGLYSRDYAMGIAADSLMFDFFDGNIFIEQKENATSIASAAGLWVIKNFASNNSLYGDICIISEGNKTDTVNNDIGIWLLNDAEGVIHGSLSTNINITSRDAANCIGLYVGKTIEMNSFCGNITIDCTGAKTNISGINVNELKCVDGIFDIAGKIDIVQGNGWGINSDKALNLRISGTILCEKGYAVQSEVFLKNRNDGNLDPTQNGKNDECFELQTSSWEDFVELSATALVKGMINLGAGSLSATDDYSNYATVNSQATVQGGIVATAGEMQLVYVLEGETQKKHVTQFVKGTTSGSVRDESLYDTRSIDLNLNYAENATYRLIQYSTEEVKETEDAEPYSAAELGDIYWGTGDRHLGLMYQDNNFIEYYVEGTDGEESPVDAGLKDAGYLLLKKTEKGASGSVNFRVYDTSGERKEEHVIAHGTISADYSNEEHCLSVKVACRNQADEPVSLRSLLQGGGAEGARNLADDLNISREFSIADNQLRLSWRGVEPEDYGLSQIAAYEVEYRLKKADGTYNGCESFTIDGNPLDALKFTKDGVEMKSAKDDVVKSADVADLLRQYQIDGDSSRLSGISYSFNGGEKQKLEDALGTIGTAVSSVVMRVAATSGDDAGNYSAVIEGVTPGMQVEYRIRLNANNGSAVSEWTTGSSDRWTAAGETLEMPVELSAEDKDVEPVDLKLLGMYDLKGQTFSIGGKLPEDILQAQPDCQLEYHVYSMEEDGTERLMKRGTQNLMVNENGDFNCVLESILGNYCVKWAVKIQDEQGVERKSTLQEAAISSVIPGAATKGNSFSTKNWEPYDTDLVQNNAGSALVLLNWEGIESENPIDRYQLEYVFLDYAVTVDDAKAHGFETLDDYIAAEEGGVISSLNGWELKEDGDRYYRYFKTLTGNSTILSGFDSAGYLYARMRAVDIEGNCSDWCAFKKLRLWPVSHAENDNPAWNRPESSEPLVIIANYALPAKDAHQEHAIGNATVFWCDAVDLTSGIRSYILTLKKKEEVSKVIRVTDDDMQAQCVYTWDFQKQLAGSNQPRDGFEYYARWTGMDGCLCKASLQNQSLCWNSPVLDAEEGEPEGQWMVEEWKEVLTYDGLPNATGEELQITSTEETNKYELEDRNKEGEKGREYLADIYEIKDGIYVLTETTKVTWKDGRFSWESCVDTQKFGMLKIRQNTGNARTVAADYLKNCVYNCSYVLENLPEDQYTIEIGVQDNVGHYAMIGESTQDVLKADIVFDDRSPVFTSVVANIDPQITRDKNGNYCFKADLVWNSANDPGFASGVRYYVLRYIREGDDKTEDGNWKKEYIYNSGLESYTYTFESLDATKRYAYEIYAVDYYGKTSQTMRGVLAPALPELSIAEEVGMSVNPAYEDGNLRGIKPDIAWRAVEDTGGVGIAEYVLQYRLPDEDWQSLSFKRGTEAYETCSYSFSNLLKAKRYEVRIIARDDLGREASTPVLSLGHDDWTAPSGRFLGFLEPLIHTTYRPIATASAGENAGTAGELVVVEEELESVDVTFCWNDNFSDPSGLRYRLTFSDDPMFQSNRTYSFWTTEEESASRSMTLGNGLVGRPVGIFEGMKTVYWYVSAADGVGNIAKFSGDVQSFSFVDRGKAITAPEPPLAPWGILVIQEKKDNLSTGVWGVSWKQLGESLLGIYGYELVVKDAKGKVVLQKHTLDLLADSPTDMDAAIQVNGNVFTIPDMTKWCGRKLEDGKYTLDIAAFDAYGRKSSVGEQTVYIDTERPLPPGNMRANAQPGGDGCLIYLSWDKAYDRFATELDKSQPNRGIQYYVVQCRQYDSEREDASDWSNAIEKRVDANTTSTEIMTNPPEPCTYEWRIRAVDNFGNYGEFVQGPNVSASLDGYPQMLEKAEKYKFASDSTGNVESGTLTVTDTVGRNDGADCFAIEPGGRSGKLSIIAEDLRVLAGADKNAGIKVEIFVDSNLQKAWKTFTAKNTGTVAADILLEGAGQYYFRVSSLNATQNIMEYALNLKRTLFGTPETNSNEDDTVIAGEESVRQWERLDAVNAQMVSSATGNGSLNSPALKESLKDSPEQISELPPLSEWRDWVGFGDAVDYRAVTLDYAQTLSFDLTATDAAKFTVYSLQGKTDKAGAKTYSLKALQSTALKLDKETEDEYKYGATTKALLLEKGTYYVSMQSTNAAKGGNAYYTVNEHLKGRVVYDYEEPAVSSADDWTDMKTAGAASSFVGSWDVVTAPLSGWVGFGDAVDYKAVTLETGGVLSFDLAATDAAKFTVYALQEKKDKSGNVISYSLKSLQSTVLKPDKETEDEYKYGATTKLLALDAGTTYYVAMESTDAKKGGNAVYSAQLNGSSILSSAVNTKDDTWKAVAAAGDGAVQHKSGDVWEDWTGFGDKADFFRLAAGDGAPLEITLDVTGVLPAELPREAEALDESELAALAKKLKLSLTDGATGKAVKLSWESDGQGKLSAVCAAGALSADHVYYLGVTNSANTKANIAYRVTLG